MLDKMRYFPVNWVDGMKISKDHFLAMENAFRDQMRDLSAQNQNIHNFGLLSPEPGKDKALDLDIDLEQASRVKIRIQDCRAITLGGARIEISQSNESMLSNELALEAEFDFSQVNNQELDIILVVNPFARMPFGEIAPEESPPRHPFSVPKYLIEVVPTDQINRSEFGRFHMPIGRLQGKIGDVKYAEYYIPPCTSIHAFFKLKEHFKQFEQILNELRTFSLQIIRKVKSINEKSSLAENMSFLAEKMAFYISEILNDFKVKYDYYHPRDLVQNFMKLASMLKTSLRCLPEEEREQLLSYLSEWTTQSPGELENVIDSVINLEYNHFDISSNIEKINRFNEMLYVIFEKVKQLDYIGTRRTVAPPPPPPKAVEPEPTSKFKIGQGGKTVVERDLNKR